MNGASGGGLRAHERGARSRRTTRARSRNPVRSRLAVTASAGGVVPLDEHGLARPPGERLDSQGARAGVQVQHDGVDQVAARPRAENSDSLTRSAVGRNGLGRGTISRRPPASPAMTRGPRPLLTRRWSRNPSALPRRGELTHSSGFGTLDDTGPNWVERLGAGNGMGKLCLGRAARRAGGVGMVRRTMSQNGSGRAAVGSPGAPALALVHHGHQHLIVDGYDNHEGLSEILDAYTAVLGLHLKHRVPLNLHLSGTLVEAIAWHAPEFFAWVEALRSENLIEIIGSAHAQPILRLFSDEHNRRQLAEELRLLETHLSVDLSQVKGFWLPERVWHTGALADLISDPALRNGGYQYVLLDDRLAYPDSSGARTVFDATTAPGRSVGPVSGSTSNGTPSASVWALPATADPAQFLPGRISGAPGLVAVPISGNLRYGIPPRSTKAWHLLEGTLAAAAAAGPGALAVYADDLEKTAAVGPWTSGAWERENVHAYEQLLAWLATSGSARPVLLSAFLAEHPPEREVEYEPGTFCELAACGAGEDYSGWWDAPAYAPYRRHLERVEHLLVSTAPTAPAVDPGEGLVDLAWKQLMVASYETAWHGFGAPDGEVAPWARATASHVRSALVTLEAAPSHGAVTAGPGRPPCGWPTSTPTGTTKSFWPATTCSSSSPPSTVPAWWRPTTSRRQVAARSSATRWTTGTGRRRSTAGWKLRPTIPGPSPTAGMRTPAGN